MERLFLAVWPTDAVVERLRELPRKDQRGVRFLDPESWHITLRFLGDANVDEVVDALDGLDLPARTVRIGPGVDLLSGRALVLPVTGLDDLADEIRRRTATIGERPERRFIGHLTIGRVKSNVPMPAALGALIEAECEIHEVTLVSSRLRPEGASYTILETWPLPG